MRDVWKDGDGRMNEKEMSRYRTKQFLMRLSDNEYELLELQAKKARTTKSGLVRKMLLDGVASLAVKNNFTEEQANNIKYELNRIGNNLNQIAYHCNASRDVSHKETEALISEFHELLNLLNDFARG